MDLIPVLSIDVWSQIFFIIYDGYDLLKIDQFTKKFKPLPIDIWSQIFYFLDNEHDLLRIAQVNNEFKSLLMKNTFWSTYINDNYKHAKFNIYDSVLESVNISHRLTIFLTKQKMNNFETFFSYINIFNRNVFNKCILSDIPFLNKDLYKKNDEKSRFYYEIIKYVNNEYFMITHYNEYYVMVHVYNNSIFIADGHMPFFFLNKFLKDGDPNRYIRIKSPNLPPCTKGDYCLSIHGNYIWFYYIGDKTCVFTYNILTFETKLVYKNINSDSRWLFIHNAKGLFILSKTWNEY